MGAVLTTILAAAEVAVRVAPIAFDTVEKLMPFVKLLYNKLTGQDITDAQEQELFDELTRLHDEFQQPLPEE